VKRKRFSEEQIIGILKEAEAGAKTKELCRKHGISDATFYNWKAKYAGMTVSEAPAAGARAREHTPKEAAGGGRTRQSGVEGSARPKMVSPQAKRQAVEVLQAEHGFGGHARVWAHRDLSIIVSVPKPAAGLRAAASAHGRDRGGEAPLRLSAHSRVVASRGLGREP
jgi:putative transposase